MCDFPGSSVVKNPPADTGDAGLIPGLGRSSGEGMVAHSSILAWENPMDRGAQWATVHGIEKSRMRLSMHACACISHYGMVSKRISHFLCDTIP